jgi:hypothetical protein
MGLGSSNKGLPPSNEKLRVRCTIMSAAGPDHKLSNWLVGLMYDGSFGYL